jgi:hypothetical protein
VALPEASTWKAVEQWLRRGGAGGEVLLVFENVEDVLRHALCAQVGALCFVSAGTAVVNRVRCAGMLRHQHPPAKAAVWLGEGLCCEVFLLVGAVPIARSCQGRCTAHVRCRASEAMWTQWHVPCKSTHYLSCMHCPR